MGRIGSVKASAASGWSKMSTSRYPIKTDDAAGRRLKRVETRVDAGARYILAPVALSLPGFLAEEHDDQDD